MFPTLAAGVSFLVSATILMLWLFGDADTIATATLWMKANTTLGIALGAVSLFLLVDPKNTVAIRASRILALVILLIGAVTMAEYLFSVSFGIDELIRRDAYNEESARFPGRMSPIAALLFVLLGLGLLTIDLKSARRRHLSDFIFLAAGTLSGIALIGYLYQAAALYRISAFIRISQYSAGCFLILSLGALFARPDHRPMRLFLSRGPEGQLIRLLLPATILIPILGCWAFLRLRQADLVNRPTGLALLAGALILIFGGLIWSSARALEKAEAARLRQFEQEKNILSTINKVGQSLAAELKLETLVQSVSDAATQLSGAQFGAFFYNVAGDGEQSYLLYTVSGVPKEQFSKFPMPRNTAVFNPTFTGQGTIRSDDITLDPRYGKNAPHHGMPTGHLPVKSYLAVPVVSRGGEVLGGLFFGHEESGRFTVQSERIVEGLAAQAAVAVDNARLYEQLQKSIQSRDEFLSVASHELKTPLTSLMLQNQVRSMHLASQNADSFSPEKLKKMLDTDGRQIDRLARLVDDMLDIGRINTGKLTFSFEWFDLRELVQAVTERFQPQFVNAGSALSFTCPERIRVCLDRHRLDQVFTNLLTNALKYGNKKPVELEIQRAGQQAVIRVRDQGIGIAPENQARIFDRFERAVDPHQISGMGLGLFIVRQILAGHQGTIRVESELGKGSTFIVEVPLAVSGAEASA